MVYKKTEELVKSGEHLMKNISVDPIHFPEYKVHLCEKLSKMFQIFNIVTEKLISHLNLGQWKLWQHSLLELLNQIILQLLLCMHMHMLQKIMKLSNQLNIHLVITLCFPRRF